MHAALYKKIKARDARLSTAGRCVAAGCDEQGCSGMLCGCRSQPGSAVQAARLQVSRRAILLSWPGTFRAHGARSNTTSASTEWVVGSGPALELMVSSA